MSTINDIYNLDPVASSDEEANTIHHTNQHQYNHNDSKPVDGIQSSTTQLASISQPVTTTIIENPSDNNEIIDLMGTDDSNESDQSSSEDDGSSSDSYGSDVHSITEISDNHSEYSSDDSDSIVSIDNDNNTDSTSMTNVTGTMQAPQHNNNQFDTDSAPKAHTTRYFTPTDITLRCYNCNGVGHYADNCVYDKIYKPCYICGVRNHQPWKCPNDLCYKCNQSGHKSDICTNQRMNIIFCILCGSVKHNYTQCTGIDLNYKHDIKYTTCYICGNKGHINCSTNNGKTNNKYKHIKSVQYCANCAATGHSYLTCTAKQMDAIIPINCSTGQPQSYHHNNNDNDEYHTNNNNTRLCFICNQPGHLKIDCPEYKRRNTYSEGTHRLDQSSSNTPPRRSSLYNEYQNNHHPRRSNTNNNYRSVDHNDRTYVESYDTHTSNTHLKRGRSRERDQRSPNNHSRSSSVSSNRSYGSNHRRKY